MFSAIPTALAWGSAIILPLLAVNQARSTIGEENGLGQDFFRSFKDERLLELGNFENGFGLFTPNAAKMANEVGVNTLNIANRRLGPGSEGLDFDSKYTEFRNKVIANDLRDKQIITEQKWADRGSSLLHAAAGAGAGALAGFAIGFIPGMMIGTVLAGLGAAKPHVDSPLLRYQFIKQLQANIRAGRASDPLTQKALTHLASKSGISYMELQSRLNAPIEKPLLEDKQLVADIGEFLIENMATYRNAVLESLPLPKELKGAAVGVTDGALGIGRKFLVGDPRPEKAKA